MSFAGGAHVVELSPAPAVMDAVRAVADWPGVVLFDSAARPGRLGRYSFLAADPFESFEVERVEYGDDPFAAIRASMERFRCETIPGLPPFQGGAAGLLSYELGRAWERFPRVERDEFGLPDLSVGLYDWVIAWDHEQGRCWLISQGWPEVNVDQREQRARERVAAVLDRLSSCVATQRSRSRGDVRPDSTLDLAIDSADVGVESEVDDGGIATSSPRSTALRGNAAISDFMRDEYLDVVRRAIDYVYAGDVFQVNVSQRLTFETDEPLLDLYERLRTVNAAPFAGLCFGGDWSVLSASPERFLQVTGREVETRPIKGTRRRASMAEADLYGRDELFESEKDRAENVMIVDLLRNDLSRVCEPGSIRVPDLCRVESYETVAHLVSEVRGRLLGDADVWDLLSATFPGGSITGAPKPRAMEIIAELERTARGPYCGCLFYTGFDGAFDSNILIRTFVQRCDQLHCRVGGGIVAQSDPAAEYAETLDKAAGMIAAVRPRESGVGKRESGSSSRGPNANSTTNLGTTSFGSDARATPSPSAPTPASRPPIPGRQAVLLIDNHDSFVHNLARYFAEMGCEAVVVRDDVVTTDAIRDLSPSAIVISPGPCSPAETRSNVEVVRMFGSKVPILGVCLGHQSIAAAFDGEVVRAREPVHGRTSSILHEHDPLFDGVPSPFVATRYHSLVVAEETLPAELAVIARLEDGTPMALRHREWPLFGVQFHPESVLSKDGPRILANFLSLAGIPSRAEVLPGDVVACESDADDVIVGRLLHW